MACSTIGLPTGVLLWWLVSEPACWEVDFKRRNAGASRPGMVAGGSIVRGFCRIAG